MGRIARLKKLYEEHGHKISIPASLLSSEDKASFGGGLRCFKPVYLRDDFGNKLTHQPKTRCKNPAHKGSLFCRKHGGNNTNALTKGTATPTNAMFRMAFSGDLGGLFNAFISDPAITDMRPELAALRTCLNKYLTELTRVEPIRNPAKLCKMIRTIMNDGALTPEEKFSNVKAITERYQTITDDDVLKRINNLCETISRIIERMSKVQNKDEFILTPEGLKILFRSVIDVMKDSIEPTKLLEVKERLMTISIRTKGDLSKYGKQIEGNIING